MLFTISSSPTKLTKEFIFEKKFIWMLLRFLNFWLILMPFESCYFYYLLFGLLLLLPFFRFHVRFSACFCVFFLFLWNYFSVEFSTKPNWKMKFKNVLMPHLPFCVLFCVCVFDCSCVCLPFFPGSNGFRFKRKHQQKTKANKNGIVLLYIYVEYLRHERKLIRQKTTHKFFCQFWKEHHTKESVNTEIFVENAQLGYMIRDLFCSSEFWVWRNHSIFKV